MEILIHLNVEIPDDQLERIMALADLGDVAIQFTPVDDLVRLAEEQFNDEGSTWMDHVAFAEVTVWPGEEEDQDLAKKAADFRHGPAHVPDGPEDEDEPVRPLTSSMSDDEKLTLVTSAIERGKAEILSDIGRDIVPEDVHSFSELHDFVDANEYGGLCDGHWPIAIIDGEEHLDVELANQVQDALDTWIKDGRP